MTVEIEQVGIKTAKYLAEQWQCPVDLLEIEKIFGGASRETFRIRVSRAGEVVGLILRRDPPSSLIDTERALEFGAYKAIFPTSLPVPEPLFLENGSKWLEQPFSIMAEIPDAITDVSGLDAPGRQRIGEEKWRFLGQLANMDPIALGFDQFTSVPALTACAEEQLTYWAGIIEADELHPQPIARAAIRWLFGHLPAPAQRLSVVHGDYRTGNFLFDPERGIQAILDWEMCHLGDPYEDLAWSLDPLWHWGEPGLAGRLLPHREAVEIWQLASGLEFNPVDFAWWRVFVSLKGLAIWISSSEDFHRGASKDAILAYAGWVMTSRQNRILLDYLAPTSTHEFGNLRL